MIRETKSTTRYRKPVKGEDGTDLYPDYINETAVLLYHLAEGTLTMLDRLEDLLTPYGWSFGGSRRRNWNFFVDAAKKCRHWYDTLNADEVTWNASSGDVGAYDDFHNNAASLLMMIMLLWDRLRIKGAYRFLVRVLLSMPSSDTFSVEDIRRYEMKEHPLVYSPGDWIEHRIFGEGVITQEFNPGDFEMRLRDGTLKVISEKDILRRLIQ